MKRNDNHEKKNINGEKFKIAIVVSRFHSDLTSRMLEGAVEILKDNNVKENNVHVVSVPGSFEVPLMCRELAATKKYDGIVAIGCVIRGETDHYHFISQETIHGIMRTMLDFSIPIGLGVITTNNLEQAIARSYGESNKGVEAAEAVLEMIEKRK